MEYIQVEQMNSRDQVTVKLRQYSRAEMEGVAYRYTTYLDVGTTVALAQLQLLRQGLDTGAPVKMRYIDDTAESGREEPSGNRWFYSVVLYTVFAGRVLADGTVA